MSSFKLFELRKCFEGYLTNIGINTEQIKFSTSCSIFLRSMKFVDAGSILTFSMLIKLHC